MGGGGGSPFLAAVLGGAVGWGGSGTARHTVREGSPSVTAAATSNSCSR